MSSRYIFIKRQIYSLFFLSIVFFLSSCAESKNENKETNDKWATAKQEDLEKALNIDMRLPINFVKKPEITVSINIPGNFRPFLSLDQMNKSPMNEFFPKKDKSIDSWSELITTQAYLGNKVSAEQITDGLVDIFSKAARDVKIINRDQKVSKDYAMSEFLMSFSHQGKRRVCFGRYYSGPYDCSGFQYAIQLVDGLTQEEAIKKINQFVKNKVVLSGKFDPFLH